ncbi:hypothetical protein [Microcoleus sp. F4-D5]|uniref:hypothetical protein n=1 Tax=Microcoleus sp. F4-D5 TaxID=2818760 RepID=UPI002FD0BB58
MPATQQSPINSGVTGMMGSGEWGVGKCIIIDLDFIIPIQPETISNLKLDRGFTGSQPKISFSAISNLEEFR